jgi:hypothetical protein
MIFNDSEQLRQEYAKLGEPYEDSEPGKQWKFILKQIDSDPDKKETIQEMTRVAISPTEEYITYNHIWQGKNPIGSYISDSQTNVGVYPKFEPIYERYINEDNTYSQRLTSKNTTIAYFIPFNKENAEQLHKICNDISMKAGQRTIYHIMPEGGTKITIDSYQDWLNGEFEDLFKNGKITTVVTATSAANKQQSTRRANESKEV